MSGARKLVTNVSIDREVLAKARALNLNVSGAAEERLRELIAKAEREAWLEENRDSIEAYNCRVTEEGMFGDKERQF
jgi:antitoxin CcdA